jgi:hypothetical protein
MLTRHPPESHYQTRQRTFSELVVGSLGRWGSLANSAPTGVNSLVTQRVDRIQARGFESREESEDDPDHCADAESDQN